MMLFLPSLMSSGHPSVVPKKYIRLCGISTHIGMPCGAAAIECRHPWISLLFLSYQLFPAWTTVPNFAFCICMQGGVMEKKGERGMKKSGVNGYRRVVVGGSGKLENAG